MKGRGTSARRTFDVLHSVPRESPSMPLSEAGTCRNELVEEPIANVNEDGRFVYELEGNVACGKN